MYNWWNGSITANMLKSEYRNLKYTKCPIIWKLVCLCADCKILLSSIYWVIKRNVREGVEWLCSSYILYVVVIFCILCEEVNDITCNDCINANHI